MFFLNLNSFPVSSVICTTGGTGLRTEACRLRATIYNDDDDDEEEEPVRCPREKMLLVANVGTTYNWMLMLMLAVGCKQTVSSIFEHFKCSTRLTVIERDLRKVQVCRTTHALLMVSKYM
jgi:hypothetical protein